MTTPTEPHFDRYARRYHDLHKVAVRESGEEPEYFAAYKIAYMADRLGREVAAQALALLDFGCGIGSSIPHLARHFPTASIYGLDVSGESLQIAQAANPGVSFGLIGETTLPLPDASMDIAFAACVFHHIAPAARLRWIAELRRVLKPSGQLFIFEHNPLNPLTQKVVRECPFDDDAILLPRRESLDLLRDGGFNGGSVDYIVFFPKMLSALRPIEKLLVKVPLGAQYVARGYA